MFTVFVLLLIIIYALIEAYATGFVIWDAAALIIFAITLAYKSVIDKIDKNK